MKNENGSLIRDIGYDKFFTHFWSDLQLKIYKENCLKIKTPTISFDATGGCCKKLKRQGQNFSGSIFFYEGVMQIKNNSFTALSMLSEQHDNVAIAVWLKSNIQPPKVVVSDQSLALMSAIVQSSKYPRTKQLFSIAMWLLIFCKNMGEAKKILEAIFIIALSKFDGPCINSSNIDEQFQTETPCGQSNKSLQSLIIFSIDELINNVNYYETENEEDEYCCLNKKCVEPKNTTEGTVIGLTAYDGTIDLQN